MTLDRNNRSQFLSSLTSSAYFPHITLSLLGISTLFVSWLFISAENGIYWASLGLIAFMVLSFGISHLMLKREELAQKKCAQRNPAEELARFQQEQNRI
ncbi:hypothetical protein [Rubinisphaera italica]|uniref:Uncharacterized protein n=1 Tax=Rubinisphaera italica TaxID=2527969 RepID=A0A5C5XEX5_9PLAN|nr:hypothetical protein [Rubinisphaera italica]TWT61209.1 hypothetical protein Pan54_19440 [Rubinisphaera italica]